MAGKINSFLREFKLIFSIILSILGFLILFVGIAVTWLWTNFEGLFSFMSEYKIWSPYLLILGFIVFGFGVWYLYSYFKDRKFILEEIQTNKRSELLKMHNELKIAVKHMPSKYKKMLKDKEDELKIR